MSEQTLLILNPASGGGATGRAADALVARAEAVCGPLDVVTTVGPGDAVALARRAAERGVARVLVAGGDGTTGEVVTGLVAGAGCATARPCLGVLPVGSGCDLARTLGLPRRLEAALEIVAAGNVRELDVGRVELDDGGGRRVVRCFANEVSAGLSGDTVRRAPGLSARVGPRLGFLAGAFAAVASHVPFAASIEIDGELVHDGPVSLVAVANGCYFGAGMQVAPDASVDDGRLEVVLARGLSRCEIVTHLPAFYLGRHGRHPQVSFHPARRVEIRPRGGPVAAAVEVDGDGGYALPLVAECLPGALRVFAREASLFARIRHGAAEVTRRARHVRIDDGALERLARTLAASPPAHEDLDPMHHAVSEPERLLAFTIALDAINFGSGWFPVLRKRGGLSGYRSIATACRESLERGDPWSGPWLRAATAESMAVLLGQTGGGSEVVELMSLYARAWQELGGWLAARHGDRFAPVVEAAGGSAERLVHALAELPLWRDVARYDELEVPFYKRAQITVADLARVFDGKGWGRFDDLDRLTLFADNLVPHVLRCHGVLVHAPALAARIDREEPIAWGSQEEVEIRAVAVEAVERLVARMAALGRPTTAHALDALLWNAGQDPSIKARPRHRTRCTYY